MVPILHVNPLNCWYLVFCTPVVANATLTYVLDFLWLDTNFSWYVPLRGIKNAWFLVPMQYLEKIINNQLKDEKCLPSD